MLAITNGRLMTITQGVVEGGTLLAEHGKITAIGKDVAVPAGAQVLDATGKWVMPGLIDAHTHIGVLGEPAGTGGMGDTNENTNPITPQVRAIDSFYPLDVGVVETRKAGFTTCCTLPGSSNLIGGEGFVFKTREGRLVEDLLVPGHEVMKFALGENPQRSYGGKDKPPKTRMGSAALLRQTLAEAREYADALDAAQGDPSREPKRDFRLEPLVPVVRGRMFCRIHCHRVDDIGTAMRIAEEFGLRYSLEHVTDGYLIADVLARKGVTCVIGPMMTGPYKREVWGRHVENPGIMAKGGVQICMTADAGCLTKNLPVHVGQCMAAGLDEDVAFRSMTIHPAELLGMADRIGSLEVGKDADIALFDGHPFCNFTHCTHTIIEGQVYENGAVTRYQTRYR